MIKLEIISSYSAFDTGNVVIGIALQGDSTPHAAGEWAESVGRTGRPATILPLNGRTLDQAASQLRRTWAEWAADQNLDVTIAGKVRPVKRAF